ncbi:MAG: toxin-antitoxin system HicB family antitoxin [Beijerinckiaceae bacterium]
MTGKPDTALADKVRQFRSNAPKLDIASLSRVKQVAGETLFHADPVGQPLASAPDAEGAITIAGEALEAPPAKPMALASAEAPRQQGSPVAGLIASSDKSIESAMPKSTLSIRIDPELHMQLKLRALQSRISLGDLVTQACWEKLANK